MGERPDRDGWKPVRVVGTDIEFDSLGACARYFRVSQPTISKILKDGDPDGDIKLEYIGE